jgi:hypothetical protein
VVIIAVIGRERLIDSYRSGVSVASLRRARTIITGYQAFSSAGLPGGARDGEATTPNTSSGIANVARLPNAYGGAPCPNSVVV